MPLDKLPSETLLAIASFLPRRDAGALSRTSRRMCSIAEIQLYANVKLEMGRSTYNLDNNPLNLFLASLVARKERCAYVRSLCTFFYRDLTYRDQVLLYAVLEVLPCLRTFSLRCSHTIDFSGDPISAVPQRIRFRRAMLETSLQASKATILSRRSSADEPSQQKSPLLTLSWSNHFDYNGPFFLSFVSLHSNIRCLDLPQTFHENFPKVDASVLPNLESVQAQITVVLALLPGRKIQRVKTHFLGVEDRWENKKTDASGEVFKEDDLELENIKVFTCQRTWTNTGGCLPFLIGKMKNLEVLDLSDGSLIETLSLRSTSVQLLKLQGRFDEEEAVNLFKTVGTLECIECLDDKVYRMHRGGKRSSNVVWRCEPRDLWLADWKKDSCVS